MQTLYWKTEAHSFGFHIRMAGIHVTKCFDVMCVKLVMHINVLYAHYAKSV